MFATLREKLKGWKTMIAAALWGAAGFIVEFHDQAIVWIGGAGVDWKTLIPAHWLPYIMIGSAVLFGYLRWITTGPVGSKSEKEPAPQSVKAGD